MLVAGTVNMNGGKILRWSQSGSREFLRYLIVSIFFRRTIEVLCLGDSVNANVFLISYVEFIFVSEPKVIATCNCQQKKQNGIIWTVG